MDLYYKLGMVVVGLFTVIGMYIQLNLDFDLMREQIGFSENIIKRKFKWYVLNSAIVALVVVMVCTY